MSMIWRRHRPARLLILWLFILSVVQAGDAFNCLLTVDSFKFDLTTLAGEHTVSRTRETPPSSMVDAIRFDLCAELNMQSDVAEGDQCPTGTRACLTKTNKRPDSQDRIISVIPLAQTASLEPKLSLISSPRGLSLIFHGASYPDSRTMVPTPQSFNVTLLCATATEAFDPKFMSYDGSQSQIEWGAPAGCGFQGDQPPDNDSGGGDGDRNNGNEGQKKSVGSGIGWFFLVLVLVLATYFGLGAYYNYTTYGATGSDLIPHRDFWREVPYMLQDVVLHLCSLARSRRTSSRGYIAV